ncbi:phosphatase PAP2 family protein [Streptomyces puniciscabiei]
MTPALSGSSADGPPHPDMAGLAHCSPGRPDGTVTMWSAFGLAVFALLMTAGWRRPPGDGARAATTAPAVPGADPVAFAVNSAVRPPVAEDRPCRGPAFRPPGARATRSDQAFPGDHTAVAFAAAVALFPVPRRSVAVASVCAAVPEGPAGTP